MKKSTKFLLIGGMSLFALGCILLLIGILTGGMKQWNEHTHQNGIVFQKYFTTNSVNFDMDFGDLEGYTILEGDFEQTTLSDADKIKNVTLMIGGGSVQVLKSEDQSINAAAEYDDRYGFKVEGDTLYIKSLQDEYYDNNNELIICVPENVTFESVDCELGAGEILASSISANEMNVSIGAGRLEVASLFADQFTFEIGAGEIIVENGTVGTADMSIALGNFEFDGIISKGADIECSMGNVSMNLEDEMKDYNYEIECAAGEVEVGDDTTAGVASDRTIDNGSDKTISVECSMGSVSINF